MEIQKLLSMTQHQIKEMYGAQNPILDIPNHKMVSITAVSSSGPGTTLRDLLEYERNPQQWCIHDHK